MVEKGHTEALPLFQATISLQVLLGEEAKDIEDIYPETYSVPYSKLIENFREGMSLDDFNTNGIVGGLTTVAGQQMRDLFSDEEIDQHIPPGLSDEEKEACINFGLKQLPEQLIFEINYPQADQVRKEQKLHVYMSVTPDA